MHTENKYVQEARLGIWLSGNVMGSHWEHKAQRATTFHLKGIISNLLSYSGIKNAPITYTNENGENETVWHWNKKILCTAKQVTPQRLDVFDIKQDVFFAEIHWDVWVKASAAGKITYKEVPKFPAVQRDLALVLDTQVSYKMVQEATEQLRLSELQSFNLFDVFESEKLGKGKKSYALSYTFQLQDRTLTETEIEQLMYRLMEGYKTSLNAQIRE